MSISEHQCKPSDLVRSNVPNIADSCMVSFRVVCRNCGKEYEEVYTRNAGLWDSAKKEYVPVPRDEVNNGRPD